MFEFLGKLFGIAIRTKSYMSLDLPSIVWKPLVNQQVDISDVLAMDCLALNHRSMFKKLQNEGIGDEEDRFKSLCLNFVITGSDGKEVPLIENSELMVDSSNFQLFDKLVCEYRVSEFKAATDALRRGLACIVPPSLCSLFCWEEMEALVTGNRTVDVELLKKNTIYSGTNVNAKHIQYFWEVLEERFGDAERKNFLRFVWGRTRLPIVSEDFERKFQIMKKNVPNPDKTLPLSHTCFFQLELPAYSSVEVMTERLTYAMLNCFSIDTDRAAISNTATVGAQSLQVLGVL